MIDNSGIDDPIPPSIYFGGCGFGAAFYVGVHRAMVERWGKDFYKHTVIAGGSAGAIMAIQVALGRDTEQLGEMYLWTAREANKRGPIFQASACLIESVRRVLDEFTEEVHTMLNDKCFVSVTHFPFRHRFAKSWDSEEDLLQCLTATCHIPIYTHRAKSAWSSMVDGAYGFAGDSLVDLHHNDTLFVGIDPTADVGRSLTFSQMVGTRFLLHNFNANFVMSSINVNAVVSVAGWRI